MSRINGKEEDQEVGEETAQGSVPEASLPHLRSGRDISAMGVVAAEEGPHLTLQLQFIVLIVLPTHRAALHIDKVPALKQDQELTAQDDALQALVMLQQETTVAEQGRERRMVSR